MLYEPFSSIAVLNSPRPYASTYILYLGLAIIREMSNTFLNFLLFLFFRLGYLLVLTILKLLVYVLGGGTDFILFYAGLSSFFNDFFLGISLK